MNTVANRYLLNMKPGTGYLVSDEAAEQYLINRGFVYRRSGFLVLTHKGIQYGENNRKWLRTGRTGS